MTPSTRTIAVGAAAAAAVSLAYVVGQGADDADVANVAYVDAVATSTLVEQVSSAVGSAFSVDSRKVKATQRRSAKVLVGTAVDQYTKLYGPILESAGATGLSLQTTVRSVGVTWMRADTAKLLVFADQSARTAQGQSTAGAAQLVLVAERVGGKWKLADIEIN